MQKLTVMESAELYWRLQKHARKYKLTPNKYRGLLKAQSEKFVLCPLIQERLMSPESYGNNNNPCEM